MDEKDVRRGRSLDSRSVTTTLTWQGADVVSTPLRKNELQNFLVACLVALSS